MFESWLWLPCHAGLQRFGTAHQARRNEVGMLTEQRSECTCNRDTKHFKHCGSVASTCLRSASASTGAHKSTHQAHKHKNTSHNECSLLTPINLSSCSGSCSSPLGRLCLSPRSTTYYLKNDWNSLKMPQASFLQQFSYS